MHSIILCRGTEVCFFQNAYLCTFSECKHMNCAPFFQDTAMSKVWFKQDDKFFLPKACLNFEFFRCVTDGEPLYGIFLIYQLGIRSWRFFFSSRATQTWCKKKYCSFLMQEVELKKIGGFVITSQGPKSFWIFRNKASLLHKFLRSKTCIFFMDQF